MHPVARTPLTARADWTASGAENLLRGLPPTRDNTPDVMTTEEAALYLRKSESWLLRRNDIDYLKGLPNTYKKADLDNWFERNKFIPTVA